jgi:hypothetical protein
MVAIAHYVDGPGRGSAPRLRPGRDAFTSSQRVKAVYAGVEKQPAIQHLHDKVESAVVRAGLEPDGQKYIPHVTLTRPKDTPFNKLQHYLAEHSLFKTEPFEVTHFSSIRARWAASSRSIRRCAPTLSARPTASPKRARKSATRSDVQIRCAGRIFLRRTGIHFGGKCSRRAPRCACGK